MTDTDLVDELTAQMRDSTRHITAVPPDLLQAVARARTQRRSRFTAGAVALVVVCGTAGTAGVLHSGPGNAQSQLSVPAVPSSTTTPTATPSGVPADPGPDDDTLQAADWWTSSISNHQWGGSTIRTQQTWFGRNGLRYASGSDIGATPKRLRNSDAPVGHQDPGVFIGTQELDFGGLQALPADPVTLEAMLRTTPGDRPEDERLYEAASQLFDQAPLTLPVREALAAVLARVPGAQMQKGVTDSLGRRAYLVRRTDMDGVVQQVYLDPVTSRLLEQRSVSGPTYGGPGPGAEGPGAQVPPAPTGTILFQQTSTGWAVTAPPLPGVAHS